MKILVIDDSPFMRKAVIKSVNESLYRGATAVEAGDGQEGLEILKKGDIGLVLSDWNMPKMNGLQFVIEARKMLSANSVPIIMITTEGTLGKMEEALQRGVDRYVVKPFTTADIETGIKMAFQTRRGK
jgi:two-component system chemotaxis response regulator CheY